MGSDLGQGNSSEEVRSGVSLISLEGSANRVCGRTGFECDKRRGIEDTFHQWEEQCCHLLTRGRGQKEQVWGEDQFNFGDIKFEMPPRGPNGDAE